ncbi:radical SAM protein [Candidatus Pacearchaeota archaeon]|nr:radical SAM protein [Candidatus Pacearchaeota archaeon]
MCHFSFMKNNKIEYIDTQLLEKLDSLKGIWIKIGSNFEPIMHPKFSDIIKTLSEMDFKIDLTTNGTLLTKKITDQIADGNLKNITVSFDSIKKQTYEKIRRRAKFESVIERLLYFREKLSREETFFAINTVLCRSNIDEIIEMINYWNANNFHQLRLIFMVVRFLGDDLMGNNELLQESLYPIREYAFEKLDDAAKYVINNRLKITLNSPYYNWSELRKAYSKNMQENIVKSDNPLSSNYFNPGHYYQKGDYPGMQVDCRSPFTFARILFNGDVHLCYRYLIGNLNETSFEDIWHGEKAQALRKEILSNVTVCDHCDYYRFCLNSSKIDVNNKINYFQQDLIEKSIDIWTD